MWGEDSRGYAWFHAATAGDLKAIGLVTVNRNEEVAIGIYSGVDAKLNPTGLLGSKQVTLDERGYHLVDIDSPVAIGAGTDFVVSLTFAYRDQADPLVYCTDPNRPPADTYVITYVATNPAPSWTAMPDIVEDSSVFLQAVFADP